MTVVRYVYSAIVYILVPFFLVRLAYRSRKVPGYRKRWNERFAVYRDAAEPGVIWFHAVSVGEVEAVLPLIRAVKVRFPGVSVLVTTTTLSGSVRVTSVLGREVQHVYLPYDLPGNVKRFLSQFRPILSVVVETEIWPNLFRQCGNNSIPLVIINARLSEKSARGYRILRPLARQTLGHVSAVAAQSEGDARRFEQIGAFADTITVMGNIKFDYQVPASLIEEGCRIRQNLLARRRVWIAASTHEGEEEQILDVFFKVRERLPETLLVLVPRHPERCAKVASLCTNRGLSIVRRSENQSCSQSDDIFIVDTLGELKLFYSASDLAFVGGSLVKVGGHNVLEPAVLGVPVIFGPYMFNFENISRMLKDAGGAVQVLDSGGLAVEVLSFLEDAEKRTAIGEKGRLVVEKNRGVMDRVLGLIDRLIGIENR